MLALDEMVCGKLCAHLYQRVLRHPELGQAPRRFDLGLRVMTAHRLRDPLRAGHAGAELQRGVAVRLPAALRDDAAAVERQHRHRHMRARFREDAHHAELAGNHAGSHRPRASLRP